MEEFLIQKVKQYQVLYNVKSCNYRDQNTRHEAWDQIGRDLNIKRKCIILGHLCLLFPGNFGVIWYVSVGHRRPYMTTKLLLFSLYDNFAHAYFRHTVSQHLNTSSFSLEYWINESTTSPITGNFLPPNIFLFFIRNYYLAINNQRIDLISPNFGFDQLQ